MSLTRKGAENRRTGETRLNSESSRSDSVFTCVLERHSKNQGTGITNVLFSRLNLIDLAGEALAAGTEKHRNAWNYCNVFKPAATAPTRCVAVDS
jgi:hypothetical protein